MAPAAGALVTWPAGSAATWRSPRDNRFGARARDFGPASRSLPPAFIKLPKLINPMMIQQLLSARLKHPTITMILERPPRRIAPLEHRDQLVRQDDTAFIQLLARSLAALQLARPLTGAQEAPSRWGDKQGRFGGLRRRRPAAARAQAARRPNFGVIAQSLAPEGSRAQTKSVSLGSFARSVWIADSSSCSARIGPFLHSAGSFLLPPP